MAYDGLCCMLVLYMLHDQNDMYTIVYIYNYVYIYMCVCECQTRFQGLQEHGGS